MLLKTLTRFRENEARLRQILTVLGKYGLADWLGTIRSSYLRRVLVSTNGQPLDRFTHDERVRLALEELGTTFVKLGQMLSTRPDLVGQSLASELGKLQTSVPADPADVIRRTIQAELGKPPEQLFAEFSPEAMASASIAQVHRARLHGGQAVAVKVQHDGIEARIHRDLDLMHGLARLVQRRVPALRNYRPVNIVREFRQTLLRELDLRAERRNLEEFSRNFASDSGVHFPTPYPELTTRRVLTMEFLDGVLGCDAEKVAMDLDLAAFARRAGKMYLDMIFRDGFFHADPHPGNYVILPGGVVGVLDCGMVGRLDEGLRREFEAALLAVTEGDVEELAERVVHVGSPPADLNRQALRADLEEFLAEYAAGPIKEMNLAAALREVIAIISRYRIVLPRNASLLLRTLTVLEGSVKKFDPTFSLMDLIMEYRAHSGATRLDPQQWLRNARQVAGGYERLIRQLPGDLVDILERFRSGQLELKHEHRALQTSVHRLAETMLAASLLLGSSVFLGRGNLTPTGIALGVVFLVLAMILGIRVVHRIRAADSESAGGSP